MSEKPEAPALGEIVWFRLDADQTVPAMVTATAETLNGKNAKKESREAAHPRVPPLSSETHVHLTVFTPETLSAGQGSHQVWDVPLDDRVGSPGPTSRHPAGTWRRRG